MSYKITIQLLSGWRSFLAFYSMRFKQATPLLMFLESPKLLYLRTATISLCFQHLCCSSTFPFFLAWTKCRAIHSDLLTYCLSFLFFLLIIGILRAFKKLFFHLKCRYKCWCTGLLLHWIVLLLHFFMLRPQQLSCASPCWWPLFFRFTTVPLWEMQNTSSAAKATWTAGHLPQLDPQGWVAPALAVVLGTAASLQEGFPSWLGVEAKTLMLVFTNSELSKPWSSQVLCAFADSGLHSFSLEKIYKCKIPDK